MTCIKLHTKYLPISVASLQNLVFTTKWWLEFILFCCTITVSLSNINFVNVKSLYPDIISSPNTLQLSNSIFAFLHSFLLLYCKLECTVPANLRDFSPFHKVFTMLKFSKCLGLNEIIYCTLMSYKNSLFTMPFLRKIKNYVYVSWEVGILYLCHRAVWLNQYRVLLAFRWPVQNSAWTHPMLTGTCTGFLVPSQGPTV